jgi:NAD(P)-dependent dehydrogenase (short-subunit alcohol dehydrogenase family)
MMNLDLRGKVVLVAGGTGGLGTAVSRAFLREGSQVTVTYRNQSEFDRFRNENGVTSSTLQGLSVDMTDERECADLISSVLAEHGRIDCVINTVGAYAGGSALWETESDIFDRMLSLNLRATFLLVRACVPHMCQAGHGSIVIVTAKAALDHAAGAGAYVASKAGATAMVESLAADLRGTGVRINSILPSIIDTEANRKMMPDSDFTKWPKADDLAETVLFLASDVSRAVHGASIPTFGAQ